MHVRIKYCFTTNWLLHRTCSICSMQHCGCCTWEVMSVLHGSTWSPSHQPARPYNQVPCSLGTAPSGTRMAQPRGVPARTCTSVLLTGTVWTHFFDDKRCYLVHPSWSYWAADTNMRVFINVIQCYQVH